MHARDEVNGVVHEEQDLQVTHILGSKGKDRGGYNQTLENVDVMKSDKHHWKPTDDPTGGQ